MEPREVFELRDKCAYPIVCTGPLHRLRPFVKWAVIVYWVVIVGISALVFQEKSVGRAVMEALPVTAICMAWLIPTRTRSEWRPVPVRITFGPDALIWDYPAKPVIHKGRVMERWEQYRMPYSEITNLYYREQIHRISVLGTVSSTIWLLKEDGTPQAKPHFQRTREKAAWGAFLEEYNSPEVVKRVTEALVRYTGKPVERHG